MSNCSPVATSDSAKCSAESRITTAANTNIPITLARRRGIRNVPIQRAGPTRCGSSAGAFEIRQVYATKIDTSTTRVDQRDLRLQGQGQRVHGREPEERHLHRMRTVEPHLVQNRWALARAVRRDEYDHRPADADQQAVRARHVGEGERARALPRVVRCLARLSELLERVPALPREHHVDGVLGQDRDEREDGDRQPRRDVELRHLGRPRQDEGRADDREAEQQRLHGVREGSRPRSGARSPGS